MIDLRAVATLGLGFGAMQVAAIGLSLSEPVEKPEVVQTAPASAGGSGSSSDAGTGYVYIDRSWVKGLKVVKVGTSWQYRGSVAVSGKSVPLVRSLRTETFKGSTRSVAQCGTETQVLHPTIPHALWGADSFCQSNTEKSIATVYNGGIMSVGADELMAIFELMKT